MPFDNTVNFVTSMAIVNTSVATEDISVAFKTSNGTTTQTVLRGIPGGGHMAFGLPQQFPAATSNQSGLAEFYSATGAFAIIGLQFNPTGAFTVAPAYSQTGLPIIVTPPPSEPLNLTGTWSGTASDSSGPGRMTWHLTQNGSAVSGTVNATTPGGTVAFNGTISGIVTSSTLTFTITIPAGGIPVLPQCTASISGATTNIIGTSMSGTYSGTNSCTSPFTGGIFTLSM